MRILFITSSRIGDAVLSCGLLDYIAKHTPDAKVTIVCGVLSASLFEGYPLLDELIPLKKQKHNKHWLLLWKRVVRTRWDIVVDLRNSVMSRFIISDKLYTIGKHVDKSAHKVIQNAEIMKLEDVPNPRLWFTAAQLNTAKALIPDGKPVLGIGATANWLAKTWPSERFIKVVNWAISDNGIMPNARVAVFAALGEEENARKVLACVPEGQALDIIAKTDPGSAAATLARCSFYIGNDSGLMHCASAVDIPTLGLFGPSYPHLYRPWGENSSYISTPESFDELIDYEGYSSSDAPCLMESLSVDVVIKKIEDWMRSKNNA